MKRMPIGRITIVTGKAMVSLLQRKEKTKIEMRGE